LQGLSPVFSINVNALNHDEVLDSGRSTGFIDRFAQYTQNQGPLIRGIRMDTSGINGLEVRGETLTTQSVWDDTRIVHVLRDEILIPDFHTYGGLRLESAPAESLVVKLLGANAGITADGRPLDIDDRIGGSLQVVGQPRFPVVFTSLHDDTIGAGLKPNGDPQNDTDGQGASTGTAGDWRSLTIERFAHDRNVQVVTENAAGSTIAGAQFIGELAPHEKAGDENLRLGFEIHGSVDETDDADVYSVKAPTGTEVWLDVDRTTHALDTIIELLDGSGQIIARSIDATTWHSNPSLIPSHQVNGLEKSSFPTRDDWTTNPRDPGLRIVLPGPAGLVGLYYVRIRSNDGSGADLTKVEDGLTTGSYQLQIRLGEIDEVPGSGITYADISYATEGVAIIGQPAHSPLTGEFLEDTGSANDTISGFQTLGNLLNTDRAALSVGGDLSAGSDVDFYELELDWDSVQEINSYKDPNTIARDPIILTMEIDYADGMARADTIFSIFDSAGVLIGVAKDSNIADDVSRPLEGADMTDLSRGSVGRLDAFFGTTV
ncbi:MAG: hypothetical protein ABGZ17_09805, partial [Planctomycetaceae bacterium]